jgi:hypothetical protein
MTGEMCQHDGQTLKSFGRTFQRDRRNVSPWRANFEKFQANLPFGDGCIIEEDRRFIVMDKKAAVPNQWNMVPL